MAEDDIVQKVVIEVDDSALAKVGTDAKQSFGQLQQASDSSSASIGNFGKAAAQTGNQFKQLTEGSSVTRGELRELSVILRSFGLGEVGQLAQHFGKIGISLGAIGVAALAAGYGLKELFSIAIEAADAAKAVEHLSTVVADVPSKLSILQGALALSGASAKDFESAFDSLSLKVTEVAAKMAQAGPNIGGTIDKWYLAGEQAAESLAGVTEQLGRMAAGSQSVLSPLISVKTVAEALLQVLAKDATSVKEFGDGMSGITLNAQKAADEINKLYNNADALTKLKIKDALKMDGVPDSVIKSLTETTDKYNELKQTAKDKAWETDALSELGLSIEKTKEQLTGWGTTFGGVAALAVGYLGEIEHGIVDLFTVSGLASKVFGAIGQTIQDTFTSIANTIGNAFNAIWGPIQSVIDRIGSAIDYLVGKAQELISALGSLMGFGGGGSVGGGGSGGIGHAATGGLFVGPRSGTDTNLAWLTSGEYVMSLGAVQKYGTSFMHAINSLEAPRFAMGGLNVAGAIGGSVSAAPRVLNLTIEGQSFAGMSVPENTAAALERFAVHSQIASTGRKQSWRR